jgi:hypothetical protein
MSNMQAVRCPFFCWNHKFVYDLWGNAVNIPGWMNSHETGAEIQITRVTYEPIKNDFVFEPHGMVSAKGKVDNGEMEYGNRWGISTKISTINE